MRYDFEEFIFAGYSEEARAEGNQSVEYSGKSLPLLKIYLAQH